MNRFKEWLLSESHFIPVFGVLTLIVVLSVTINLTMQNQDNRQEAASRSSVSIQSNATDCSNSGGVCVNLASWQANPTTCAGVNVSNEYSCGDPSLRCCVLATDGSRPGTPGQGTDPNIGGPGTDPGNNNGGQDPNSGNDPGTNPGTDPGTNPGSGTSPTPRAGSACSVQGGYCSPNGSCGTGYKQASIDGCQDMPCCVPNSSSSNPSPTSTQSGSNSCTASYAIDPGTPAANSKVSVVITATTPNINCVVLYQDDSFDYTQDCKSITAGKYTCTINSKGSGSHKLQLKFGQKDIYPDQASICGSPVSCNVATYTVK